MTSRSTQPVINHLSSIIRFKELKIDENFIETLASGICKSLELNVIEKAGHTFEPSGNSLVYILSESHLAIHSWPEYKTVHIDLVSCVKISKKVFDETVREITKEYSKKEFRSHIHEI